MDLEKLWNWDTRKLGCRIRSETCNPAGDELRERFSELAGLDYRELVTDMKNTKKRKDQVMKLSFDFDSEKTFKDILNRSHILGAAQQALQKLKEHQDAQKVTIAKKNRHKQYALIPKTPPRRVMLDVQRVRAMPDFQLPDQDEDGAEGNGVKLDKRASKAKMSSIFRSAIEEEEMNVQDAEEKQVHQSLMGNVLKSYSGDMFGSSGPYLDSMIYLSRMADVENKSNRKKSAILDESKEDRSTVIISAASNDQSRNHEENRLNENDDFDNNDDGDHAVVETKLFCAASLCNWSRDPANANRLASEGAVRAILQLLMEPHYKILKYCASAYRYMSEHLPLALLMIEEGVTNTIADTILSASDDFITHNLAITLVNLTRISGKEPQLVDAAVVLALQNLIVIQPDLSGAAARGLYNLTCVDTQYNYIERVIRALVTLSTSTLANVKHICAAALCNLSDLRSVRPRLVEEGVVSVVGQLARGAETRTRRICAVILQNLSASKLCRVDMTSKSSVSVTYGLSADQDPIILRAVSLTLSRLATEPINCNRIVHEGGITALCNIGVKYPTIPGISQPIAIGFQLLSSRPTARLTIVQEGSITAIASLLRISNDMITIQNSLLALCHLLLEPESHLSIVQQGLVITLMNLMSSNNDNNNEISNGQGPSSNSNNIIKDLCSLAFFNLSCQKDSRKHIVNAGAVVTITSLSYSNSSDITKRRCAATLCNISFYEQGFSRMVSDGVIQCLVNLLLSSDVETIHYSCAAICRLCITEENGRLVFQSGAIPNLVQGAFHGTVKTKQFCGAVLSALSFYEICRVPLCEYGILKVLSTLSSLKDEIDIVTPDNSNIVDKQIASGLIVANPNDKGSIANAIPNEDGVNAQYSHHSVSKQRCLIAYANLSCEKSVQDKMIDEGVVKIISSLADSYQEANYLCCAKAMCNLSCNKDLSIRLAQDGGINALLMICMVHSVDQYTKLLCVQTFLNLLNDDTVEIMVREGIIGAIANLSKIDDDRIVYICALLFNQLTKYESARYKIVEKPSYLLSLFNIYHNYDNLAHASAVNGVRATNPQQTTDVTATTSTEIIASPNRQLSPNANTRRATKIGHHSSSAVSPRGMAPGQQNSDVASGSNASNTSLSLTADHIKFSLKSRILVARTCSNLLLCKENQVCEKTLESGAIRVIEKALIDLMYDDESAIDDKVMEERVAVSHIEKRPSATLTHCLLALQSACLDMRYSQILASQHLLLTLIKVAKVLNLSTDEGLENYLMVLKIIVCIGWDCQQPANFHFMYRNISSSNLNIMGGHRLGGAIALQTEQFTSSMIDLINTNYHIDGLMLIVTIMRYMVVDHGSPIQLLHHGILESIIKVDNSTNKEISSGESGVSNEYLEYLSEIIRLLVESDNKECLTAMASPSIISILMKIVTTCSNNVKGSSKLENTSHDVLYDAAVIIYHYSTMPTEYRQLIAIQDTAEIINVTSRNSKTFDLHAASLCAFLFDSKCRYVFATPVMAELLVKILSMKPNDGTLNNTISSCFAMSKLPKCREFLTSSPISMDAHLIALSQKTESSKVRHNCARVLKNLTADSSEAIEEGAVAALIAISLEGRPKSRLGNEVSTPEVVPLKSYKNYAPACAHEEIYDGEWYEEYSCKEGGAAGKGPDPPPPPEMLSDSSNQYPTLIDESEHTAEYETKTKMAFAKMQVPIDLRSSYLLTEDELTIKLTDIEDEEAENKDASADRDILQVGGALDNDANIETPIISQTPNSIRRSHSTKAVIDRDSRGLKSKFSKKVMSQRDLREFKRNDSKELYHSSNNPLRSSSPAKPSKLKKIDSNNRTSWPASGDESVGKNSLGDEVSVKKGKASRSMKNLNLA